MNARVLDCQFFFGKLTFVFLMPSIHFLLKFLCQLKFEIFSPGKLSPNFAEYLLLNPNA